MYKCRHFSIEELISPEIWSLLSEDACWRLIPPEVVYGLDTLRDMYGRAIWINGKGLSQCGVRAMSSKSGVKLSGHKLFRGETCFDLHCDDIKRLEDIVRANHISLGIGRMENTAKTNGWLHVSFIKGAQNLDVFDP